MIDKVVDVERRGRFVEFSVWEARFLGERRRMYFKKREDVFIQIVKSQGITRTRVLPDQEKEVSKNKQ